MSLPRILDTKGRELGYSSLSLSRSLEQIASKLQFSSHESYADLLSQVVIVDDGETRFTGILEQITGDEVNGFSHSARSLTSTLLLVDAAGNEQFRRSTIRTVVEALANFADVNVAAAPTDRVQRFRLQKGEDAGRALQRLADAHRFVITDDASGAIHAYRAPEKASAIWVERSGSITRPIGLDLNFTHLRNEWVCRGQREVVTGDLDSDGTGQLEISVTTGSPRKTRRVLPNRSATSRADARNFVEWQAKKALASTVRVTVVHNRWPAEVGTRVRIRARSLNIDEDFIVASLALEASESAVQVTASCVLPDVYEFRPLSRRRGSFEKRVSTWKSADGVERL